MNYDNVHPGLVSVVTPTYNCADFLRESIESALSQSYENIEIIVVDDGSTDHTRAICSQFGDRVRYIYRENDGTRGNGARARAILESNGEWVALLDHDDLWSTTKIEKQVAAIRANDRAGIVFTSANIIDANRKFSGERFEGAPSGDVFHSLLSGQRYCASSALVSKAAVHLVRSTAPEGDYFLSPTYKNNDTDLWIRIARHYDVIYLNEPLTYYRFYGGNDSSDRTRLLKTDYDMLCDKSLLFHHDCRECFESHKRGLRKLRIGIALSYFDNFISKVANGQAPFSELVCSLKTDFGIINNPRRFCLLVKYLLHATMNSLNSK